MPVGRLNSISILANSQPLAERALYWVRQLDSKTDLLANVHVYNVLNYKAKNLADILSQVYGGAPTAAKIKESKLDSGSGSLSSGSRGPGRVGSITEHDGRRRRGGNRSLRDVRGKRDRRSGRDR